MTNKLPYLLQTGMGVDLHGSDDTKAAKRAIRDAIANNSLLFLKHLELNRDNDLIVDVAIACPNPEKLDVDALSREFPAGRVSVQVQKGGMQVDPDTTGDPACIAIAAVQVALNSTTS